MVGLYDVCIIYYLEMMTRLYYDVRRPVQILFVVRFLKLFFFRVSFCPCAGLGRPITPYTKLVFVVIYVV